MILQLSISCVPKTSYWLFRDDTKKDWYMSKSISCLTTLFLFYPFCLKAKLKLAKDTSIKWFIKWHELCRFKILTSYVPEMLENLSMMTWYFCLHTKDVIDHLFFSCPSNFRTEIALAERISCHEIKINCEIRDTARDFVMQKLFPIWDEILTHLSHTKKFPERAFKLTLSITFPFSLGIYCRKMHILPHPLKIYW